MKRPLHQNEKVALGAHGSGLFATDEIKKGEVVTKYWGAFIAEFEAARLDSAIHSTWWRLL
jgi:hypothetical protein